MYDFGRCNFINTGLPAESIRRPITVCGTASMNTAITTRKMSILCTTCSQTCRRNDDQNVECTKEGIPIVQHEPSNSKQAVVLERVVKKAKLVASDTFLSAVPPRRWRSLARDHEKARIRKQISQGRVSSISLSISPRFPGPFVSRLSHPGSSHEATFELQIMRHSICLSDLVALLHNEKSACCSA